MDGVGAFDLIRLFHSSPSTFLWEDDVGTTHHIRQGEGSEQCDPLMPLLFALGQHTAISVASGRTREGEQLMAFLHGLYAVSPPDRTVACHNI